MPGFRLPIARELIGDVVIFEHRQAGRSTAGSHAVAELGIRLLQPAELNRRRRPDNGERAGAATAAGTAAGRRPGAADCGSVHAERRRTLRRQREASGGDVRVDQLPQRRRESAAAADPRGPVPRSRCAVPARRATPPLREPAARSGRASSRSLPRTGDAVRLHPRDEIGLGGESFAATEDRPQALGATLAQLVEECVADRRRHRRATRE